MTKGNTPNIPAQQPGSPIRQPSKAILPIVSLDSETTQNKLRENWEGWYVIIKYRTYGSDDGLGCRYYQTSFAYDGITEVEHIAITSAKEILKVSRFGEYAYVEIRVFDQNKEIKIQRNFVSNK